MRRVAASAALAVVLLDVTAMGVLLPTLRTDLGSSPSGGQWIMNAYLLALAIVLPLALRVRVDQRLLAGGGAAALAAGAIVCATADSTSTLVIGRAFQGAGVGALIVPVTGPAAAVLPLAALAIGPVVGGELADRNWWHLWFWAGVPAAAALAAIALRRRETPERTGPTRRELAVGTALIAATILLVQSEPSGIGTEFAAYVLGLGGLAVLLVAAGPDRGAWAIAGGALAALCFLMPQYFELGHLIHPLRSGVRLSALTVPVIVGGVAAWRLRTLVAKPILLPAGALTMAAGALALLWIDEHSGNLLFGAGLALVGVGCGVVVAAARDADPRECLVAAALGAALTLAVSGALFQHRQAELRSDGASFEHALSGGAAYGAGFLLVSAAALVAVALRARRESSSAPRAAES